MPFPSPGHLPDPGIEPRSLALQTDSLPSEPPGKINKTRQCIKKQGSHLPIKVHIVKSMVFPVAMYGCEIWTIKEAEHQRIGGFELWCWRRILRVPWTGRRSNQSILKEINVSIEIQIFIGRTDAEAEAPILGHLMQRADSLQKTLMLGKTEEEKGATEDEMVGWYH